MIVKYVDHMGTDLSVVNSARVSFGKKSETLSDKDEKLIAYLSKHEHWTPFAHTCISLHIKAPLFVARQLGKHQVGLVWNEISRRYVDFEPEIYEPDQWRGRATDKKQGSDPSKSVCMNKTQYINSVKECIDHYTKLIDTGVAPELARMVLPQSMYTEWYWTGSLYSFNRVCKLRLTDDAQYETKVIAKQIAEWCGKLFPTSWKYLQGEKNGTA